MLKDGRYERSKHNDDCLRLRLSPHQDWRNRTTHKVGILVDDYLSVGHKDVTDVFMERISKVQGDVHSHEFMGMHIHRDRGARVIEFDQERAILDFFKEWNMSDCKGRDTPMDANLKLPKIEGSAIIRSYRRCTDRKLGRFCNSCE